MVAMKAGYFRNLRARAVEFAEHTTEASCACAVMMVQGQLLLLSAAHWMVAIQTGVLAGALGTVLIALGRATRPWIVSAIVGVATTIADFIVHSGSFVAVLVEAILTGIGAAALAFAVTAVVRRLWRRFR